MADPIQKRIALKIDLLDNEDRVLYEGTGDNVVSFFRGDSLRLAVSLFNGTAVFNPADAEKISVEIKATDVMLPPQGRFPFRLYKEVSPVEQTTNFDFVPSETALRTGLCNLTVTLWGYDGEILTAAAGRITVLANGRNNLASPEEVQDARDEAVRAAHRSCACADRSEGAADGAAESAESAKADADRAKEEADRAASAEGDVSALVQRAEAAAENAESDAAAAAASKVSAETASAAAAASATGAAQSESNASVSAAAAENSADAALQSAADAIAAKDAAVPAAVTAVDAANAAVAARNEAVPAAAAAVDAANTAIPAASAAIAARDEAVPAAAAAVAARNEAVPAAETATSEADRSTEEADRAQSIADNLEAVGTALSYRDDWTGSTAPTGAQRGWFWVINGAGAGKTWGGITWQEGDAALYNGSTWQRVAIDWLLAQANANIDALRREVDIRKQPTGGIYCDQAGGAVVPISTNYLAQGGTQSFSLGWVGKTVANASTDLGTLFGSGRGVSSFNPGSAGIAAANASGTLFARAEINVSTVLQMPSGVSSRTAFRSAVLTFDASTKQAEFFVDGVSVGTEDWSTATLDSPHPLKIIQSTASLGSVDVSRSPSGYTTSVAAWTKALTATEVAEWSASGGKIMPISARANCASHITCDDGAGYQLRDRSGNGNHALLTTSGFTHLIPADGSPLAADGVNASSATYLLRSGPVLPSSAIVTGVIVDGEYLPATGAQSSAQTRIRLNPTGGDLEVQRSDGSTHTPIATFTPASLASVDVKVISQSAS